MGYDMDTIRQFVRRGWSLIVMGEAQSATEYAVLLSLILITLIGAVEAIGCQVGGVFVLASRSF
jgi:hypothetical protein